MPFPPWQHWSLCSASLGAAIFKCPWSSGLQQNHCHHPEDKCPVLRPQNNHRRINPFSWENKILQGQAVTKGESWGWGLGSYWPEAGSQPIKPPPSIPPPPFTFPYFDPSTVFNWALLSPTSSSGITEYQSLGNAQDFCDKIIKAKCKEAFQRSKRKSNF